MTELLEKPQTNLPEELPTASLIEASRSFDVIKNPYDRMEYVHLTDKLIHRLEGSEDQPAPDFVIFLDKSARPVSWLTRELWNDLAREPGTTYEENKVPERPPFLYLNIDSKHMFGHKDIPGLRSLFTVDTVDSLDGVEEKPTFFDGKKVLVIDEIGVSHATSVKAKAYLEMAFPEAEIDTFTWMDQGPATNYGGNGAPPTFDKETLEFTTKPSAVGKPLQNNLRWYEDRSHLRGLTLDQKRFYDDGRGIVDRDAATEEELQQLDTPRTKFGRQWLSVWPETMQPKSRKVMNETKAMAEEIRTGVLPYWPDAGRDDAIERIESFNGVDARSFTEFRPWFKEAWWGTFPDAMVAISEEAPLPGYKKIHQLGQKAVEFAISKGLYQ